LAVGDGATFAVGSGGRLTTLVGGVTVDTFRLAASLASTMGMTGAVALVGVVTGETAEADSSADDEPTSSIEASEADDDEEALEETDSREDLRLTDSLEQLK